MTILLQHLVHQSIQLRAATNSINQGLAWTTSADIAAQQPWEAQLHCLRLKDAVGQRTFFYKRTKLGKNQDQNTTFCVCVSLWGFFSLTQWLHTGGCHFILDTHASYRYFRHQCQIAMKVGKIEVQFLLKHHSKYQGCIWKAVQGRWFWRSR